MLDIFCAYSDTPRVAKDNDGYYEIHDSSNTITSPDIGKSTFEQNDTVNQLSNTFTGDAYSPSAVDRYGNALTGYEMYGSGSLVWTSGMWKELDGQCGLPQMIDRSVGSIIANLIWFIVKMIGELVLTVFYYAAIPDALAPFLGPGGMVQQFLTTSINAVFAPFLIPTILLTAVWVAWVGLVRRRSREAIQGVVWVVGATVAAILFLSNPTAIPIWLNSATNQIQAVLINGIVSSTSSSAGNLCQLPTVDESANAPQEGTIEYAEQTKWRAIRVAQCSMWEAFMFTPWASGQFGSGAGMVLEGATPVTIGTQSIGTASVTTTGTGTATTGTGTSSSTAAATTTGTGTTTGNGTSTTTTSGQTSNSTTNTGTSTSTSTTKAPGTVASATVTKASSLSGVSTYNVAITAPASGGQPTHYEVKVGSGGWAQCPVAGTCSLLTAQPGDAVSIRAVNTTGSGPVYTTTVPGTLAGRVGTVDDVATPTPAATEPATSSANSATDLNLFESDIVITSPNIDSTIDKARPGDNSVVPLALAHLDAYTFTAPENALIADGADEATVEALIEKKVTQQQLIFDKMVELKPTRMDIVKSWTGGNLQGRIGVSLLSLIAIIAGAVPILMMTLSLLLYQLTMLFLLLLAPVFLTIGINPGFGRRIALGWVEQIINISIKRVAVAALLGIMLAVVQAVTVATIPWIMQVVLIIMISVGILTMRGRILGMLASVNLGGTNAGIDFEEAASNASKQGLGLATGVAFGAGAAMAKGGSVTKGAVMGGAAGRVTGSPVAAAAVGTEVGKQPTSRQGKKFGIDASNLQEEMLRSGLTRDSAEYQRVQTALSLGPIKGRKILDDLKGSWKDNAGHGAAVDALGRDIGTDGSPEIQERLKALRGRQLNSPSARAAATEELKSLQDDWQAELNSDPSLILDRSRKRNAEHIARAKKLDEAMRRATTESAETWIEYFNRSGGEPLPEPKSVNTTMNRIELQAFQEKLQDAGVNFRREVRTGDEAVPDDWRDDPVKLDNRGNSYRQPRRYAEQQLPLP